ncbi:hypothetical protein [Anaerobacillus arseniciselenatis]|uniref:hypothetical protein n=1 Tax=Anaerobacillus arseniciselenatis TaxID=85682 RepID=UPI001471664B|nr:hypothetical protein [Anaerobacillus arseniciselenatis]
MMQQFNDMPNFDLGYELMVRQMEGNTLTENEMKLLQHVTSVVDSQIEELLQTIQI